MEVIHKICLLLHANLVIFLRKSADSLRKFEKKHNFRRLSGSRVNRDGRFFYATLRDVQRGKATE